MFPGSYVPRVLCSPGPMFPGSYVTRVLCSPGPMFPGSYVGGRGGGGGEFGTKCYNLVPNSVNWYQVYITKVLTIVYYFSKFSCSCTQYTFKQIFMPYV